jgi:hypothetical protein
MHSEILGGGMVAVHPFVFAPSEQFDLLVPDGNLSKEANLGIVTKDQVPGWRPPFFQDSHGRSIGRGDLAGKDGRHLRHLRHLIELGLVSRM